MLEKLSRRLAVLIGLMTIISAAGWGQKSEFEKIDQHARSLPPQVTQDVATLASALVKPTQNDQEKVRSFYVWITDNIAYDVRAFRQYRADRYQQVTADEVLSRRTAVCQGYAILFQALCQQYDIPCYVVPGYSKGFNRRVRDFAQGDHAWNAVELDDRWYLLDVTWGSGGLNQQLQFVEQFDDKYFLTRPDIFVQDHLPLDPMWQLLDCPISISSFATDSTALPQDVVGEYQKCGEFTKWLTEYTQSSDTERELEAAQRAYSFNPANFLVIVQAYMNRAHHLMSSIPQMLHSREAIEAATVTQEEAMTYLKKAESILTKTKEEVAVQEKEVLEKNLQNGQSNLEGFRKALQ